MIHRPVLDLTFELRPTFPDEGEVLATTDGTLLAAYLPRLQVDNRDRVKLSADGEHRSSRHVHEVHRPHSRRKGQLQWVVSIR